MLDITRSTLGESLLTLRSSEIQVFYYLHRCPETRLLASLNISQNRSKNSCSSSKWRKRKYKDGFPKSDQNLKGLGEIFLYNSGVRQTWGPLYCSSTCSPCWGQWGWRGASWQGGGGGFSCLWWSPWCPGPLTAVYPYPQCSGAVQADPQLLWLQQAAGLDPGVAAVVLAHAVIPDGALCVPVPAQQDLLAHSVPCPVQANQEHRLCPGWTWLPWS